MTRIRVVFWTLLLALPALWLAAETASLATTADDLRSDKLCLPTSDEQDGIEVFTPSGPGYCQKLKTKLFRMEGTL